MRFEKHENCKAAIGTRFTLAVVIPTWRRTAELTILLNSLPRQNWAPDEIIIACRHDDIDSLNLVQRWIESSSLGPRLKLATVYQPGHLPPLIESMRVCESDIFAQIDDDAIPRPDWVEKLQKDFQDPGIGGVSGTVIDHPQQYNGKEHAPLMVAPGKLSWFGRPGKHGPLRKIAPRLFEANCFSGGNMAFRTKVLTSCIDICLNGGAAFCYETDIAINVQKMGYGTYYDPELIVDHYPAPRNIEVQRGLTTEGCFWHGHNLTYTCLKHLRWRGRLAFLFYFFIIGQWKCPAPATYVLALLQGHHLSFYHHLLPSMKGRLAGMRSWLRFYLKGPGQKLCTPSLPTRKQ